MLKRLTLMMMVLLLLPALALAQDDLTGTAAMARSFPANTIVFGAIRTDEDFLTQLETLSQPAIEMAQAAGTSTMSLHELLDTVLGEVGTDLDTVMTWLGDDAAFGVTPEALQSTDESLQGAYAAIEIADRAGADAFLKSALPPGFKTSESGDYTVYTVDSKPEVNVALSDDLMLIYPGSMGMPLLTREARLDSSPDYLRTIGALPAQPYNVLLYADPRPFGEHIPLDTTGKLTLDTAPLAVGSTVIGSTNLIDVAQLPIEGTAINRPAAVDPDFAQFIPGNSSGVIHATNLTALYNDIISLTDAANGGTGATSAQIEQLVQTFGFSLQGDLLSWTTGDYALFYRTDLVDFATNLAMNTTPDLSNLDEKFDFGLEIEATDSVKAQMLSAKLGALLSQMLTGTQGITTSTETIGGNDVTVFSLHAPLDQTNSLDLDLLLGATGDVFFLATRSAAETIINGDGMLPSNPGYMEAQDYVLPNPSFVYYADAEGLITGVAVSTIIPLALLGPNISNTFDNIIAELQTEGGTTIPPTKVPTPTPVPENPLSTEEIVKQIEDSINAISSSSLSASVTEDGINLTRFAITSAP